MSRRGSTSSGVGGSHTFAGGSRRVCFDIKEGSSSSEVGVILWLDEDAFDIEGPTTERNIVGVAHFYACANPLIF